MAILWVQGNRRGGDVDLIDRLCWYYFLRRFKLLYAIFRVHPCWVAGYLVIYPPTLSRFLVTHNV